MDFCLDYAWLISMLKNGFACIINDFVGCSEIDQIFWWTTKTEYSIIIHCMREPIILITAIQPSFCEPNCIFRYIIKKKEVCLDPYPLVLTALKFFLLNWYFIGSLLCDTYLSNSFSVLSNFASYRPPPPPQARQGTPPPGWENPPGPGREPPPGWENHPPPGTRQTPPQLGEPPWDQADTPLLGEPPPPPGRTPPRLGEPPLGEPPSPREADFRIRSTSGRYASSWNAFLLLYLHLLQHYVVESARAQHFQEEIDKKNQEIEVLKYENTQLTVSCN